MCATRLAHSKTPTRRADTLGCLIKVWRSETRPFISESTVALITSLNKFFSLAIEIKGYCLLNIRYSRKDGIYTH